MPLPDYEQQTPSSGIFIASDNSLNDIQQVLESGVVVVNAVSSADPVPTVGEATVPKIENITAWAGKFLNSDNQIIDLLEFLTSGAMQVQVIGGGGGGAPTDATYLTNVDETGVLPNSFPLTGTTDQINYADGVISLSSDITTPGNLNINGNFNVSSTTPVNAITNSGSSFSSTALMTAFAVQAAISAGASASQSFRGGYDASSNLFPATGGSGVAGAVATGDYWLITTGGTLGGQTVTDGDEIIALTDVPGQTSANWFVGILGVSSVFGRPGDVIAQTGDYDISQITNGLSNVLTQDYIFMGNASNIAAPTATQTAMNILAGAQSSGKYLRSDGTNTTLNTIQAGDVPTLNQNTTGQSGSVAHALTINNSGSGVASGGTFNGSAAITISYNSIGASPLAGSSSITALGTIATGTWQANVIDILYGGTGNTTGQAASVASALTFNNSGSGAASGTTFDGSAARTISYNSIGASPLAGSSSIVTVGTIATGTWSATAIAPTKGGTGLTSATIGDLIYASGTNVWANLSVGANPDGYVLTLLSGLPAWSPATGGGLTFNTVTASTQAMAVNNTYYSTYAGTCVMTLPASAVEGDMVEIITDTSHLIQIAQNANQLIYCGAQNGVSLVTTTGTGGSITTISPNTIILLKCIVANTTWTVVYSNNSYSGA